MAISADAIFDMDDAKLKAIIRGNAPHIAISQDDMLNELDRRASRRQARASYVLSLASTLDRARGLDRHRPEGLERPCRPPLLWPA
jgi:hypothetical protein